MAEPAGEHYVSRVTSTTDHELGLLIGVLPAELQGAVRALAPAQLLEVVMDLGRTPEARLEGRAERLAGTPVGRADIDAVLRGLSPVGEDNRTGIEGTLHRISVIRNRRGDVVGLTLRVGRAVVGAIELLRDLVETGQNVLLLGRPGVGKTTKLREIARVLADDLGRRVVVVDTSNEIGGDGDVPHPGIGAARRMQVPRPDRQHAVMIEAVENHMPEVIVVDEIGTAAEAAAARTIAERGVQLIGTAHGNTLENLVLNPTLSDLVGGVHTVTLGDEEARRRRSAKTVTERRGAPTFDVVVEMVGRDEVVVHHDAGAAVDRLLAGEAVRGERRQPGRAPAPAVPTAAPEAPAAPATRSRVGHPATWEGPVRIYLHAISRDLLVRALRDVAVDARIVNNPEHADMIFALRARADDQKIRRLAEEGRPVHTVKRNSGSELRRALQAAFPTVPGMDDEVVREAIVEIEQAVERAVSENITVALRAQPPPLRKVQHRFAARHHLIEVYSEGNEPFRHLVVRPAGGDDFDEDEAVAS
jgi:stage III sporulation protein SpoIIIAA